MDLLDLPTGLALLALVGAAAGIVAWNRRRRRATLRRNGHIAAETPPSNQRAEDANAHRVAAQAVSRQLQARAGAQVAPADAATPAAHAAPEVAPVAAAACALAVSATSQTPHDPTAPFEGPAWAPTEPMPGIALEPEFADTMPAEMNFAATHFADTLVSELATQERASPLPGTRHRPA